MAHRYFQSAHPYYCGVDLHARSLFVHVCDPAGTPRFERELPAAPGPFLDAIAPFRPGLIVGVECMFAWYWLADLCEREAIPFVLGHALAMKAIHGGKSKNDRLDAATLAGLLRSGYFPTAYTYPKEKRDTRDLLRRRSVFVRRRAQLITHIQLLNAVQPAAVCQEAHLQGQPHGRPRRPFRTSEHAPVGVGRPGPDRALRHADRRARIAPHPERQSR
jgi:hypothetical protein